MAEAVAEAKPEIQAEAAPLLEGAPAAASVAEVEAAAEALAQRQPPRLVQAAAERRVQHHMHVAHLVEEAFDHQRFAGGHYAQRGTATI